MKLLIVTQAVDAKDPVLGFFIRWIEELAKRRDEVIVICLREGAHDLPKNVRVFSLGKERGRVSKFQYSWRFLRLIVRLRREYDTVFIHMNQEYALLGGWLWKSTGKNVYFWRNHVKGSVSTDIACAFTTTTFYTSPDAYIASKPNSHRMPIGIDLSEIPADVARTPHSVLFLGRLDPIKHVLEFVDALAHLQANKVVFAAMLVGSPTYPGSSYAGEVLAHAKPLVEAERLTIRSAVPHDEALRLYSEYEIYCNLTASGSFDKTIGEAMAAGCLVVTRNGAVRDVIPTDLFVESDSIESIAHSVEAALKISPDERERITALQHMYIQEHHSLELLMNNLVRLFETQGPHKR
jgi:glycosyltransferase involved in cell wall biosynthesis